MEKKQLARQELYDLVWSEPLISLYAKYNISGNELYKICKEMDIPLPNNDYWLKKRHDKTVLKKELSQNYSAETEIFLSLRDNENLDYNSPISIRKLVIKSYECIDNKYFTVPSKLTNPDTQIIEAQKKLIECKNSKNYRGEMVYTPKGYLDIHVFPENIDRALRIFDTFIKLLRYRNYEISFQGFDTHVNIYGVDYKIAIREKQRFEMEQKGHWTEKKAFPTNILIFKNDGYDKREFYDNSVKLEEKIPNILADLEYKSISLHKIWAVNEKRWQEEEEKLRIANEIKARKELEIENFKKLLKESMTWHQSIILDNYLKELERRAIGNNNLTDDLKEWLSWAKQKASWYNPFIKKKDDILSESDRLIL
jgi:hypothetical protein